MRIRTAVLIGVLALLFIGLPMILKRAGLVMNVSPSVPEGFYRVATDGQFLAFCLSLQQVEVARQEGLKSIDGDCPGGIPPLLKPFAEASPERPLTLTAGGFERDGVLMKNTRPKDRSGTGRPLAHYPFGTYMRGVWAVSSYSADSYDSRYFGPVEAGAIRFRAKPVWTW